MTLKIEEKPTFAATISVKSPDGVVSSIGVLFNALSISKLAAFDLVQPTQTAAFLRAAVVKVDDVVDTRGDPITFTATLLDQLLDLSWVRSALVRGYYEGVNKASSGN